MSDLTVFILPADFGDNIKRLKDSFKKTLKEIDVEFVELNHRNISKEQYKVETDWFSYLFSNEYIQESLAVAIPVFLRHAQEDCLTLVYRNISKEQYSQAPRIFRNFVKIKDMMPLKTNKYSFNKILDGFIEG